MRDRVGHPGQQLGRYFGPFVKGVIKYSGNAAHPVLVLVVHLQGETRYQRLKNAIAQRFVAGSSGYGWRADLILSGSLDLEFAPEVCTLQNPGEMQSAKSVEQAAYWVKI